MDGGTCYRVLLQKMESKQRRVHPGKVVEQYLNDRRDYDSVDLRYIDDSVFDITAYKWTCCGALANDLEADPHMNGCKEEERKDDV